MDFSPYAKPNEYGLTPLTYVVASSEGYHPKKYKCQAGVDTNGFGHTGGKIGDITLEQSIFSLNMDIAEHTKDMRKACKGFDKLPGNVQGALVSLSYNAGMPGPDLMKAIEQGNVATISDIVGQYNKYKDPQTGELKVSRGLEKRRDNVECAMIDGNKEKMMDHMAGYYNLGEQLRANGIDKSLVKDMLASIKVERTSGLIMQDGITGEMLATVTFKEEGKKPETPNTYQSKQVMKAEPVLSHEKPVRKAEPVTNHEKPHRSDEALKEAFLKTKRNGVSLHDAGEVPSPGTALPSKNNVNRGLV